MKNKKKGPAFIRDTDRVMRYVLAALRNWRGELGDTYQMPSGNALYEAINDLAKGAEGKGYREITRSTAYRAVKRLALDPNLSEVTFSKTQGETGDYVISFVGEVAQPVAASEGSRTRGGMMAERINKLLEKVKDLESDNRRLRSEVHKLEIQKNQALARLEDYELAERALAKVG